MGFGFGGKNLKGNRSEVQRGVEVQPADSDIIARKTHLVEIRIDVNAAGYSFRRHRRHCHRRRSTWALQEVSPYMDGLCKNRSYAYPRVCMLDTCAGLRYFPAYVTADDIRQYKNIGCNKEWTTIVRVHCSVRWETRVSRGRSMRVNGSKFGMGDKFFRNVSGK